MRCHVCRLLVYQLVAGPDRWPDGAMIERCERCHRLKRMLPESEVQLFREWNARAGPSVGKESFEYFLLDTLGRKPEGWRSLVKYPEYVKGYVDTLDTLEEMLPIPEEGDHLGRFITWMKTAVGVGLVKDWEERNIKVEVGPHM